MSLRAIHCCRARGAASSLPADAPWGADHRSAGSRAAARQPPDHASCAVERHHHPGESLFGAPCKFWLPAADVYAAIPCMHLSHRQHLFSGMGPSYYAPKSGGWMLTKLLLTLRRRTTMRRRLRSPSQRQPRSRLHQVGAGRRCETPLCDGGGRVVVVAILASDVEFRLPERMWTLALFRLTLCKT